MHLPPIISALMKRKPSCYGDEQHLLPATIKYDPGGSLRQVGVLARSEFKDTSSVFWFVSFKACLLSINQYRSKLRTKNVITKIHAISIQVKTKSTAPFIV